MIRRKIAHNLLGKKRSKTKQNKTNKQNKKNKTKQNSGRPVYRNKSLFEILVHLLLILQYCNKRLTIDNSNPLFMGFLV